jgi:N-acetylmuramoyl-L-alanine amidase.
MDRRHFLQAGLAASFLPLVLSRRGAAGAPAPSIHPRADWGADLPPRGPLEAERPEDVRFLLVHHSVSANDYPADAVPDELRSFFRLHTAPEKGWPDIAYNFLVDRFGGIWEGRAGSIDAPVKGDATGGSQGFAILCCFIGDHRSAPPSPEAQASMVALLAWLAGRYGIDPRPGATTSFVSRGSNRWPTGSAVTTTTIAGHRDMSRTVCPGDAAYNLVRNDLPTRVAAALGLAASPPPVPPSSGPATTTTATTIRQPSQPEAAPTTTLTSALSTTAASATPSSTAFSEVAGRRAASGKGPGWPIPLAALMGVVATVIGIRLRTRNK